MPGLRQSLDRSDPCSRIVPIFTLLSLAFIVAGCASVPRDHEPLQLKVSLFPWVPEADSLVAWVERDFESRNPDIDLIVRPLAKSHDWQEEYVGDLAYEIEKTVAALKDNTSDAQHLVEVDTMILGALIDQNAVSEFGGNRGDFLPFAAEAVSWEGDMFGVPHWTCGYFILSESAAVSDASSVDEIVAALNDLGTDRVDLVGDLDGSWDSIMVYLDSLRDTSPAADLGNSVGNDTLDPAAAASLRKIGGACSESGASLCGSDGVERFAAGDADALVGYSERLHPILVAGGRSRATMRVSSAPLGKGDNPTLFTDALVLSPRCTDRTCRSAAKRFADYYISDRVFETSLMALDLGEAAIPRYLLPSTLSAFEYGIVANDSLYRQLKTEVRNAKPFPIRGVPEARERGVIREKVKEALGIEE